MTKTKLEKAIKDIRKLDLAKVLREEAKARREFRAKARRESTLNFVRR